MEENWGNLYLRGSAWPSLNVQETLPGQAGRKLLWSPIFVVGLRLRHVLPFRTQGGNFHRKRP